MLNKRAARKIIYIFLAISGAVMVFLNTCNYGPGITNDSLNYIYSGTHLNLLKGFFNFDGSTFINWPPMYSFIIFLISCVSSDIFLLITIFNLLLYFLTIILIGKIAECVFTVPAVKIIYTATLAFSYQFLYIYTKVWSETVFLTFIILITLLIINNSESSRNKYVLILLSLCLLTRYLGISIIITYYLHKTFLESKLYKFKNKIYLKNLFLSILVTIPTGIWLIRNKYLASDINNFLRFNSPFSIFDNFYQLFNGLSILFIPESLNFNIRITIFILMLTIIISIYLKPKIKFLYEKFFTLYFFVYICVLVALSSILFFERISYRFLIPIYFVLLIIVIYPIEHFIKNAEKKSTKILLWILLLGILIFPIEKGLKHTFINFHNGVESFHSKNWVVSETISYIKTNLYKQNIYSNSVAGIYANTGLKTKRFSDTTKNNPYESGIVLVIFNKNLPEIETVPDLSGTLSAKDSIIYFYDSYIIFRKD